MENLLYKAMVLAMLSSLVMHASQNKSKPLPFKQTQFEKLCSPEHLRYYPRFTPQGTIEPLAKPLSHMPSKELLLADIKKTLNKKYSDIELNNFITTLQHEEASNLSSYLEVLVIDNVIAVFNKNKTPSINPSIV